MSFTEALDIEAGYTLMVNVIAATTWHVPQCAVCTFTPDFDPSKADCKTLNGIAISGGQPGQV